jgi:hypothetical protein
MTTFRPALPRTVLLFVLCTVAVLAVAAVPAAAAECSTCRPWWHVVSSVRPAGLAPGGEGIIAVQAVNVGDGPTAGTVTLTDVLPAGLSVVEEEVAGEPELRPAVQFYSYGLQHGVLDVGPTGPFRNFPVQVFPEGPACSVTGGTVSCVLKPANMEHLESSPNSPFSGAKEVNSFEDLEIRAKVRVASEVTSLAKNRVLVSGGGSVAASVGHKLLVSSVPPVFGVEDFSMVPEAEGGGVDVQAGSHPFQLTTSFSLNQNAGSFRPAEAFRPPALPRNLQFKLPPGFIGNATALPRCTDLQFTTIVGGQSNECPQGTVVGVVAVTIDEPLSLGLQTVPVPLFNLTPGPGEPARFGFTVVRSVVTLDTSVRTGSDYGVTVSVNNISQLVNFLASSVTFWGVPGDSRHDEGRGWDCLTGGKLVTGAGETPPPCVGSSEAQPPPFLTMPTSCKQPFTASVEGSSWPTQASPGGFPLAPGEHGEYSLMDAFERPLQVSGCNQLPFAPSIEVSPDVSSASTATGLKVDVKVPQEVSENGAGVSSSNVKDIIVALPPGVAVNPAGGNGLESCEEPQAGYTGSKAFPSLGGAETATFTPGFPEPLEPGLGLAALGFCPNASKIGTVDISSPLLPAKQHVRGSVYLASQNANPFGSLVAAYILAEDPVSGTVLKLPGEVRLCETVGQALDGLTCEAPGQLITKFANNPQLAFEDAELHFFGGERAPLSTPSRCGTYTTTASFTPWSGTAPVTSQSHFEINTGPKTPQHPEGTPCPGATLPFSPTLTGGTTNINAGAFSPLTTTIGREDGNQDMQSVQLHMPAGLSGVLSHVSLCDEADANAGTCGPQSLIGETTVSAGVGNDPVSVKGGRVYITEKYAGAPFGLSIVNPVKAGPFDLEKDTSSPNQNPACDCVVVRAKIAVDPHTAALTITTDAAGSHAIPHLIDGIPVQIQKVNVLVNRPGFTFNPTNCNPTTLTGTIASDEGASSPVSVPFQPTNCAALKFTPKFSVSSSGKTSKANGASLNVKLSYPNAPQGSQANIARVKVDLPKQLPSRLTTLQKACTSAQFNANPAGCPVASRIGFVTVTTPLLPVPLTGPAIFVSHGGEAFPSLTMVLQGYGVSVDLVGSTFISKAGITSTTFKTIPDVPFNTFMLTLPQGKFSALAANGNLCKSSLVMPTSFVAQNGLTVRQATKVAVTGCAKHKTKKAKKRRGARRGQHKPAKK